MGKLVLSRKKNERIFIETNTGEHIIIEIEAIHGNRVSVGIDAPREHQIRRGEYKKQHENQNIRTDTIGEQITGDTTNDVRSPEATTP